MRVIECALPQKKETRPPHGAVHNVITHGIRTRGQTNEPKAYNKVDVLLRELIVGFFRAADRGLY